MNIYKDSTTRGQWHYCFKCGRYGDMIDLAAGVWGISQAAAIRKLAQSGVPIPETLLDDRAEYDFTRIKKRNQCAALWRLAREQLDALTEVTPVLRRVRDRLGLYCRISKDRWLAGPGQMFGAATMAQVQDAMLPPGSVPSIRRNNGSLIFRQSGWREVILLPFFSAPKNLEGFLFVGREARREDRIYRRVDAEASRSHYEGGLFGLDNIEQPAAGFDKHVVAVDDAIMALQLQIRHYAQSTRPLPLVAWYDRRRFRTQTAWHVVGKPVTVWAFRMNASALYAAMQCEGNLAITPLEEVNAESISHYLRQSSPTDHLRRVIARGKPWRQALVDWSRDQPHSAIEELLLAMQSYNTDVSDLARLMEFEFGTATEIRSVRIGCMLYTERGSAWFYCPATRPEKKFREQTFTEYVLRLDYVTSSRVPMYIGRVLWRGKQVPFISCRSKIGVNAQKACIQSGLGVFPVDHRARALERVAIAFQRPQVIRERAGRDLAASLGLKFPSRSGTKPHKNKAESPELPSLTKIVPVDPNRVDPLEDVGR